MACLGFQPLLLFGQQVEQQRTQAFALQIMGYGLIPWTAPAAAAPVSETHQPARGWWHG